MPLPMHLNLLRKLCPTGVGIVWIQCHLMHLRRLWKQIRGLLVPGEKSVFFYSGFKKHVVVPPFDWCILFLFRGLGVTLGLDNVGVW